MRRESQLWFEQARKDLEVAKQNLENEAYYLVAFLCQQVVEKSLKAFFIERNKESPGTTHSLIHLASKCGVPEEFFDFLKELAPEFVATRYPDIADESPFKLYSKKKVEGYIEHTEELFTWIEDQMKKSSKK